VGVLSIGPEQLRVAPGVQPAEVGERALGQHQAEPVRLSGAASILGALHRQFLFISHRKPLLEQLVQSTETLRTPKYLGFGVELMSQSKGAADTEKTIVEGILEALSDKHSQLDINLQGMSIRFPRAGISIECNGLITLTSHVRDITEDEKKASASRNVALMSK
jgi:hypothetical protein